MNLRPREHALQGPFQKFTGTVRWNFFYHVNHARNLVVRQMINAVVVHFINL